MGDDRVSHATRTVQEEATAAALAFVREGVLVCDIGWRVILANKGAGRLVGVCHEDLPGRDLRAVLPAARTERVGGVLRRAAAGEGGEVAIRLEPDERWLHLRCEPHAAGGWSAAWTRSASGDGGQPKRRSCANSSTRPAGWRPWVGWPAG